MKLVIIIFLASFAALWFDKPQHRVVLSEGHQLSSFATPFINDVRTVGRRNLVSFSFLWDKLFVIFSQMLDQVIFSLEAIISLSAAFVLRAITELGVKMTCLNMSNQVGLPRKLPWSIIVRP